MATALAVPDTNGTDVPDYPVSTPAVLLTVPRARHSGRGREAPPCLCVSWETGCHPSECYYCQVLPPFVNLEHLWRLKRSGCVCKPKHQFVYLKAATISGPLSHGAVKHASHCQILPWLWQVVLRPRALNIFGKVVAFPELVPFGAVWCVHGKQRYSMNTGRQVMDAFT